MKSYKYLISGKSGANYDQNQIFSKKYAYFTHNGSKIFREDENIGLSTLKKNLENKKIKLLTTDLVVGNNLSEIEIHFFGSWLKEKGKKYYCVLPEVNFVDKKCDINILKNKYDKIFTNIESDIDKKKVFQLNQPQSDRYIKSSFDKKKFCCIIANNKNLIKYSKKSGYASRINVINWYLKNYPNKISIYGRGWDKFYSPNYFINRPLLYLQNYINYKKKQNKQFKGAINKKIPIISQYKFNFCFENYYGSKGYFTEKIFDTFYASTIPIYLGCSNVEKYIPKNIFINFKSFKNMNDLYDTLNSIDKKTYKIFQDNIIDFLSSKKFKKFHYNRFVKILSSHISSDLK